MLKENISNTNDSFERYKERLSNFSGEFELGLFLFIARKSTVWIVIFFAITFGFAYLYLRYTPKVYEANSIIQIQSSNQAKKLLNVEELTETENGLAESVELLRSKVFFNKVLSKLPLQISYFAEGTFRTNELYKNSPFRVQYKLMSDVLIGTKIYVSFSSLKKGNINYKFNGKEFTSEYKVGEQINLPQLNLLIDILDFSEIEKQQNQVKKNSYYFTINDTNALADDYYSFLDVKLMNEQAKTIQISFKDFSPQKAAEIVTTITNEYNSFDVQHKRESSQSVLEFIDKQQALVYNALKLSENEIQQFRKGNNLGENENIVSVNANRLNSMEDQIISLELQENNLGRIESEIRKSKSIDTYSLLSMLNGTSSEKSITEIVDVLHGLLVQKEELLYVSTTISPGIKGIDEQINNHKRMLIESIISIKNNIKIKKDDLVKKSIEFDRKMQTHPENEIEYSRLQRLYSINEKYYNLLLEKKTEYSISNAGFVPQNIVLEKAEVPLSPISPNRKVTLIIYSLTATLLSLLLIFIRYLSHNEINSLNEITKYTQASISILGIVPRCKQDIPVSQLLVDKSPKSLIAEAFRSVRTNLQFISNEPGSKIIAITSTISGEGKTFVAINLAGIIAFSGKKVLIIDLDMRKPKIHIGFGVENSRGMSTLLIGKDSIEEGIQRSHLENLDIITAGPVPPNPSELIISKKMNEVLEYLRTIYDVIIIDNPPVGLVSDGIAMIQKADYPIYIFRADYSKRNFIQNVDRLFNEANISRLSVLLNGVDVDRKNYGYNYGYGYGYGYGSGYGYYDEDSAKNKKKNKNPLKY